MMPTPREIKAFLVLLLVTAMVVTSLLVVAVSRAFSQEHHHPPAHEELHEKFYKTWLIPNGGEQRTRSCCDKKDCYPTKFKNEGGTWFFMHRETGTWKPIPAGLMEYEQRDPRESPDGQNHVCASDYGYVFCAVLGGGI